MTPLQMNGDDDDVCVEVVDGDGFCVDDYDVVVVFGVDFRC